MPYGTERVRWVYIPILPHGQLFKRLFAGDARAFRSRFAPRRKMLRPPLCS